MIANPTPFSFCNFQDRLVYLENVLSILEKIDESDLVALKPHNADERADYIVNNKIYIFLTLNFIIPFHLIIDRFCRFFIHISALGGVSDFFIQILIHSLIPKVYKIVFTLPTLPSWRRTFMP